MAVELCDVIQEYTACENLIRAVNWTLSADEEHQSATLLSMQILHLSASSRCRGQGFSWSSEQLVPTIWPRSPRRKRRWVGEALRLSAADITYLRHWCAWAEVLSVMSASGARLRLRAVVVTIVVDVVVAWKYVFQIHRQALKFSHITFAHPIAICSDTMGTITSRKTIAMVCRRGNSWS
jgi:hypothetical protein